MRESSELRLSIAIRWHYIHHLHPASRSPLKTESLWASMTPTASGWHGGPPGRRTGCGTAGCVLL